MLLGFKKQQQQQQQQTEIQLSMNLYFRRPLSKLDDATLTSNLITKTDFSAEIIVSLAVNL